jgi:hypothetical protein
VRTHTRAGRQGMPFANINAMGTRVPVVSDGREAEGCNHTHTKVKHSPTPSSPDPEHQDPTGNGNSSNRARSGWEASEQVTIFFSPPHRNVANPHRHTRGWEAGSRCGVHARSQQWYGARKYWLLASQTTEATWGASLDTRPQRDVHTLALSGRLTIFSKRPRVGTPGGTLVPQQNEHALHTHTHTHVDEKTREAHTHARTQ